MQKVELILKDKNDTIIARKEAMVTPENFESAEENLGKLQYYLLSMVGIEPMEFISKQIYAKSGELQKKS